MQTQTNQHLKEELQRSFLIKMKVPADQADTFVEKLLALPEDKREKALETVRKAENAFIHLIDSEIEKTQTFLAKIEEFHAKTKQKYEAKLATLMSAKSAMQALKSKVKKQK